MVTNVIYDLHKHLHLPQSHLMTAGWLGCNAKTVIKNRELPASQPNLEVRHLASQRARLWSSVVSYNVACALQNGQQEGNMPAI